MSDYVSYSMNASMGGALEMSTAIQSILNKIHTAAVVKVISVESGATGAVGYVDVLPLVKQLASDGSSYSSAKIKKLPYFRLQGGMNAVIIDPQVGDLGIAIFAERDISAVKREKKESAPASLRKYDLSDGLYLGGFLNGAPSQYIHFLDGGGINVVATGEYNVKAPKIVLDAPVETTSTVQSAGDITDNTAGGNSETMASMRAAYNSHTHKENGQGNDTNAPNQKV